LFLDADDSSVLVHFGSDRPLPTRDAAPDTGPLAGASPGISL
jgi:hypothetical protein